MSPKEAILIRKLVPELGVMPLQEFIESGSRSPTFDLGTFIRPKALLLREMAAEHGLRVTLEPEKRIATGGR